MITFMVNDKLYTFDESADVESSLKEGLEKHMEDLTSKLNIQGYTCQTVEEADVASLEATSDSTMTTNLKHNNSNYKNLIDEDDENESENDGSKDRDSKWTPKFTKILMEERLKMEPQFQRKDIRRTYLYSRIVSALRKAGLKNCTTEECVNKFKGMMTTYRRNILKKITVGRDDISWPYFDAFDKVYGNNPNMYGNLHDASLRKKESINLFPTTNNIKNDSPISNNAQKRKSNYAFDTSATKKARMPNKEKWHQPQGLVLDSNDVYEDDVYCNPQVLASTSSAADTGLMNEEDDNDMIEKKYLQKRLELYQERNDILTGKLGIDFATLLEEHKRQNFLENEHMERRLQLYEERNNILKEMLDILKQKK